MAPHVEVWRSVRAKGETKTPKSRRTIALPRQVVTILTAVRAAAEIAAEDAGRALRPRDTTSSPPESAPCETRPMSGVTCARPSRRPESRALDRRLTSADHAAIVSKYQAGELQKEFAEKYGISLSSVKRLIREAR